MRAIQGCRRERALPAALILLAVLLGVLWLLARSRLSHGSPAEAPALLQRAITLHAEGDLRGAADAARRAATLLPDWPEAHLQLGIIYSDAREYELARGELERAVRLAPEEAAGWGQLGKLFLTTGRLDAAETALQRAAQLRPDRATYRALLGEVYRQRGDAASAQKAVTAFRQALALDPRSADAFHRLGLACERMGRLYEAGVALEAATRLAPAEPAPYYALAQVERRLGRKEAAGSALRTFRRLTRGQRAVPAQPGASPHPTVTPPTPGEDARPPATGEPPASDQAARLLGEGRHAFFDLSQPDRAITLLEQARQLDPRRPEIAYSLGLVLHFVGRLEEAEGAFRAALALDPQNPRYHAWLGTLHLERGPEELQSAIDELRRSVELGPEYAYGHYQLGRAYLLQDRPAEAATLLEQTIALNPNYREAYYSLGQADLRLGRRDAAQRALAEFRRRDALERERRHRSILARARHPLPGPN